MKLKFSSISKYSMLLHCNNSIQFLAGPQSDEWCYMIRQLSIGVSSLDVAPSKWIGGNLVTHLNIMSTGAAL